MGVPLGPVIIIIIIIIIIITCVMTFVPSFKLLLAHIAKV